MLQGRYADSESLLERCQAIEEEVLGLEHPQLALTLNDRAVVCQAHLRADRDACGVMCQPACVVFVLFFDAVG